MWSSDIPLAKKLYLNVFFFGTRMFATHIVSFFLYCVLIPICATAPEVTIPFWALVYMVRRACLLITRDCVTRDNPVSFNRGGVRVCNSV